MKNYDNLIFEIREELKGERMTLCALDNAVMGYGLPTAYDEDFGFSNYTENSLQSLSYWLDDNAWINVVFKVLELKGELDTVVEVTGVELL